MPQIPSRLPREYQSPSPDHRTWYTGVVNTVLRYSNVLHLHQRVCHKVGDTMVRTSRFTTGYRVSEHCHCCDLELRVPPWYVQLRVRRWYVRVPTSNHAVCPIWRHSFSWHGACVRIINFSGPHNIGLNGSYQLNTFMAVMNTSMSSAARFILHPFMFRQHCEHNFGPRRSVEIWEPINLEA